MSYNTELFNNITFLKLMLQIMSYYYEKLAINKMVSETNLAHYTN